ncbi:MAG: HAMP domain-containing protein, partial [Alphaproteobacteria bacterium]
MVSISSLPVRLRIVLLAVVPVVGLIATGGAAYIGQRSMAEAFQDYETNDQFSGLAAIVRVRVQEMRAASLDFTARRMPSGASDFDKARVDAVLKMSALRDLSERTGTGALVNEVQRGLASASQSFGLVRSTIETIGMTPAEGLNARLENSVRDMETLSRRVAQNFDDGAGILEQVLQLRRHEKDYMMRADEEFLTKFREARTKFINETSRSVIAPNMKADLLKAGELYWPAFDAWVTGSQSVATTVQALDTLLRSLDQTSEKLNEAASKGKEAAGAARAAAEERTTWILLALVGMLVTVCALFSLLIGRSITGQIGAITGSMRVLAGGDTSVEIPVVTTTDELGEMAHAVSVFRDNAIAREQLEADSRKEASA